MALLVYLLGMPDTLFYERSPGGAGMATFTYGSGPVASLAFTWVERSWTGSSER